MLEIYFYGVLVFMLLQLMAFGMDGEYIDMMEFGIIVLISLGWPLMIVYIIYEAIFGENFI